MLLVPLSGRIAEPVDMAMSGGAALLKRGPLPGSLVVLGDRGALTAHALDRRVLVVSAAPSFCGATIVADADG